MPDSNRNWKSRYFFVQGMDWVCRQEEWVTMPHGFDNTWGIIKDSASVHPYITVKQEAFNYRVLEIPFDERRCRDLITLDTLQAYCGGPEPTFEARRLNAYSRRQMEAAKQSSLVKSSAVVRKQKEKEGASSSTPKGVTKRLSKRKSEGKDYHPFKKGPALPANNKPKKSLPSKPSHRVGKGLMKATGPVTQGTVCHLLTHKEHAVAMVESIIKEMDLDPCAEQTTEKLRAAGLFDLLGRWCV